MKVFAILICFLVPFQLVWNLCCGDQLKKMEVEVKVKVGLVDCFDCAVKKIFPPEAFLGTPYSLLLWSWSAGLWYAVAHPLIGIPKTCRNRSYNRLQGS
ncbi:hypothetical protein MLD38_013898 [Melastoma candidum]|uniref:Uncharacterized protein n=1 Tax=Melastoma candidum TaxID=119954 RepID=A0ACB9RCX5_9MYRT|nr:hypothetical protein MLD38_013898 [Melastoma candidum]